MALRLYSFYPSTIVIDGEVVDLRIKRLDPNQAVKFNRDFERSGVKSKPPVVDTDPDVAAAHAEKAEDEAKQFIVDSISSYVSVEPDMVFVDDKSITSGADLVAAYGARDEVLGELLLQIFLENRLNVDQKANRRKTLAPFVPTPADVAGRMVRSVTVTNADVWVDLGCGTGSLVIAAALAGVGKAIGYDIDPERIQAAKLAADVAGVGDRCEFLLEDFRKAKFTAATVVSLYLLPGANVLMRPKLVAELPAGARVVTHAFPMGGGWEPTFSEFVQPPMEADGTVKDENKPAHNGARWIYAYAVDQCRKPSEQ